MKTIITAILVALLTACNTTTHDAAGPEVISYTEHIVPSEYFAGSPQIPGTTYIYHKRTQILSASHAQTLRQAANDVDPANNNPLPDNALAALDTVSVSELNDYETAFYYRTRGYAYMAKKEYRKAAEALRLALDQRDYLSLAAEAAITKNLAVLHFELQEYEVSLQTMFKVSELLESVAHDDFYLVARIQEKKGDYKNALKNINKAILLAGASSPADTDVYYKYMAMLYEKMKVPSPQ